MLVTTDTLLTDGAQQVSLADWQALFKDQNVAENTTATIWLTFADDAPIQDLKVTLRCARNAQIKLDMRVRARDAADSVAGLSKNSPKISKILTEWLRGHSPKAVFVPPFYGTVPVEELRSRAVIGRMLCAGDQSHAVRNLVAGLSAEQLTLLHTFLEAVVGARITERTSGDALQAEPNLRVTFTDSNGGLELSAAGAGLINLIALYAALARWSTEASQRPDLNRGRRFGHEGGSGAVRAHTRSPWLPIHLHG